MEEIPGQERAGGRQVYWMLHSIPQRGKHSLLLLRLDAVLDLAEDAAVASNLARRQVP